MEKETLLVEIRSEELPPAQVWALARQFPDLLLDALKQAGFADACSSRLGGANQQLATPRRFAAVLEGIRGVSVEQTIQRKGPKQDICYGADGLPTKALEGFMRSVGVSDPAQLIRIEENGNTYLAYQDTKSGVALAAHLARIVEQVLLSINAPRLMRWGDHSFKFIRPIRGVLMMHGHQPILSGTVLAVAATENTSGHPVLAADDIRLSHASHYQATLAEVGAVMVDMQQRRNHIIQQFEGDEPTPASLLDEVVAMCERPAVYQGTFDSAFLALPDFCVEGCMIKHQRAFPIYKKQKLTTNYRFITDNQPSHPQSMVRGFDRVIRARLQDIEFYINEDKKQSLEQRLEQLENVTYHRQLGSQRQRVDRLQIIATQLATAISLPAEALQQLQQAVTICKSDLTTLMIDEYPELEGLMAAEYYCPKDTTLYQLVRCHQQRHWQVLITEMAEKNTAYLLLLTNQMEKLVGMFGIGEKPSGNKDPHGLRSAAMAVVDIQQRLGRLLPLADMIQLAHSAFPPLPAFNRDDLWDFISERKKQALLANHESEVSKRVINAVLATRQQYVIDIEEKSTALIEFLQASDASALIAINKRIKNILRKSSININNLPALHVDRLIEPEEKSLHASLSDCQHTIGQMMQRYDYIAALRHMLTLQSAIDVFFQRILVNAPEENIRINRFVLINQLNQLLSSIGDLSKL